MLAFLQAHPNLRTTAFKKLETGKSRCLIPAPIQHWLAESLILAPSEEHLFASFREIALGQTGLKEVASLINRLPAVNANCSASDFKNFNILHDLPAMQRFWHLVSDSYIRSGACAPGQLPVTAICGWLANCLYDMAAR